MSGRMALPRNLSPRGGTAMIQAAALAGRLFSAPGCRPGHTKALLEAAAFAHANLLVRAGLQGDAAVDRSIAPILAFLGRSPPARARRGLLCHPLFLEGLHSLAPFCPELRRWHDSVTTSSAPDPTASAAKASLGNVALAIRLRSDPHWQGDQELCTDVLGRIGFPFCNWSLTLRTEHHEFVATRAVKLSLRRGTACWRLADADEPPFLIMPRADCLRMIVGNSDRLERRRLRFAHPRVRPRLQWASPLRPAKTSYDPITLPEQQNHAALTGGLVEHLFNAIRGNAPAIYRELRAFMHTIRGFELPNSAYGVIASFSDPTLPGVMGFNVTYTPDHQPCLDPLCFTWFGHELGHTKDYLIDNILYVRGQGFLQNPAAQTGIIPRYGRSLSVRTLFQVPYVHLYEWALLMDFWERNFRGLPWPVAVDAAAVGEDLAAEIEEAFALIEERAQVTRLGLAALRHFRGLFMLARLRWRSLRSRMATAAAVLAQFRRQRAAPLAVHQPQAAFMNQRSGSG